MNKREKMRWLSAAAGGAWAAWAACMALSIMPARAADVPFMTRAELEKLPLVSVADPKVVEGALVFPDVRTGIHLPREQVPAGEPVPAWLIVKSLTSEPQRGIAADFDLGGVGEKARAGGTARLQLARLKDGGEAEVLGDLKGKVDANTTRALLPAQGFLVNAGDVRNLSKSPLSIGQYRLRFWAEGQRSEATFRIVAGTEGDAPTTRPRSDFADLHQRDAAVLNWVGAFQGRPQARGGQMNWPLKNGYMALRSVEDLRLGMAMGVGDLPASRYYPRLADIPSQDEAVAITAKFVEGSTSKLQIKLTPLAFAAATRPATGAATQAGTMASTAPVTQAEVQLPAYPAIYLLVESLERPRGMRISSERQGGPNSIGNRFNLPYVIDAALPAEWTSRLNFTGKARLTVIFASEPIRGGAEQEGEGYDHQIPAQFNRGNRPITRRWTGVVRSAPLEFVIKPPARGAERD
jgi:hypothetical protein